mmetsp:Transcript_11595/g.27326  ORF Transcript_11595/g.27326 Transcript_11595/m.27326 type:complete len:263 (+) Transcript_11595:470-1258(+)
MCGHNIELPLEPASFLAHVGLLLLLLGLLGLFLCLAVAVLALPLPLLLRGGLWFPLLRLDRLEIAILLLDLSSLLNVPAEHPRLVILILHLDHLLLRLFLLHGRFLSLLRLRGSFLGSFSLLVSCCTLSFRRASFSSFPCRRLHEIVVSAADFHLLFGFILQLYSLRVGFLRTALARFARGGINRTSSLVLRRCLRRGSISAAAFARRARRRAAGKHLHIPCRVVNDGLNLIAIIKSDVVLACLGVIRVDVSLVPDPIPTLD